MTVTKELIDEIAQETAKRIYQKIVKVQRYES